MTGEFEPDLSEGSVGVCASHAWGTLLDHLGVLLFVGLLVGAVGLLADGLLSGEGWVCTLFGILAGVFIAAPLEWGYAYLCLHAVRDDEPRASDVLRPFDRYREVVVAHLRRTGVGRSIIAVRDNPDTASAYTVPGARTKLTGGEPCETAAS